MTECIICGSTPTRQKHFDTGTFPICLRGLDTRTVCYIKAYRKYNTDLNQLSKPVVWPEDRSTTTSRRKK